MSTSEPSPAPARRRPGPRTLIAAVVALVAAVGVAFAIISLTSSAADPVAQAATATANQAGYRMRFSLAMTVPSLSAPIKGSGAGSVDLRHRGLSMSMALDFSGVPQVAQALHTQTFNIDMIVANPSAYVKLPSALTSQVPSLASKPWLKVNVAKAAGIPGLSALGNNPVSSDPTQTLDYLRAASDQIQDKGKQRVNGTETTHYHARLNLDRLTANVPSSERAVVRQALSKLEQAARIHDLPIDVWVDAQHLVRRVVLSLTVNAPGAGAIHENVSMDILGYGPQPRPTPPPAGQVSDISSLLGAP